MLDRDKDRFKEEKKIDKRALKRVTKKMGQHGKFSPSPLLKNIKEQMRDDPFIVNEDDREYLSSSGGEEEDNSGESQADDDFKSMGDKEIEGATFNLDVDEYSNKDQQEEDLKFTDLLVNINKDDDFVAPEVQL